MATESLLFQLRGRVHPAGYFTRQLRSGTPEPTPEFLLEALLELQQHIEDEGARHPAPSPSVATQVARRLRDYTQGIVRERSRRAVEPDRAWWSNQVASALDGRGELTFEVLLCAMDEVLTEYVDRQVDAQDAADVAAHRLDSLRWDLSEAERRLEEYLGELSEAFGETVSDDNEEAWERLLDRVGRPMRCPVPGCDAPSQRARHPRDVPGTWPVSLCVEHTAVRFAAFWERVTSEMPGIRGAVHDALVPYPALAHLAPSPEDLAGPEASTRYQRIGAGDEA